MRFVPDRRRAFTLIELLLVIAVISIMTAMGILSYRRFFETNRLDKVAIGMQHVLEAAMVFHVDHNKWPEAKNCDSSAVDDDSFVTQYLPNANYQSDLGTNFCWNTAGSLFWVAVKIEGDSAKARTLAQRLAARLPNAISTNDPASTELPAPACDDAECYVRTEITVPGSSSNQAAAQGLAAMGDCKTGQTIVSATGQCEDVSSATHQYYRISFNACSTGAEPVITVTPNFVELPRSHTGYKVVTLQAQGMTQQACTNTPDSKGKESCQAAVTVTVCLPNGIHDCKTRDIYTMKGLEGASYVVSCIENKEENN